METKCKNLEPLIALDEKGKSLILDYNLPQKTERDLISNIELRFPFEKTEDTGKSNDSNPPKPPVKLPIWKNIPDFLVWLAKEILQPSKNTLLFFPGILKANTDSIFRVKRGTGFLSISKEQLIKYLQNPKLPASTLSSIYILNTPIVTLYTDLKTGAIVDIVKDKQGNLSYSKKLMAGTKGPELQESKIVPKRNPMISFKIDNEFSIFLQFHLKMLTYPGKTGLGKVVKTISLLPGEELELYTSNYLSETSTRLQSENIIDSSSITCEETFKNSLSENVNNSIVEGSSAQSYESDFWFKGKGSYSTIGIWGQAKASAEGGFSSNSESLSSIVSDQVSNFSEFTTAKTNQSNQYRCYEVKTESFESDTTITMNTNKRKIKNVNTSHVLNFVFRQVVQEYISIISLKNVIVLIPKNNNELIPISISELPHRLKEMGISEKQTKTIVENIYQQLNNIYDYKNEKWSMLELQPIDIEALNFEGFKKAAIPRQFKVSIKKGIKSKYNEQNVEGIILDVTNRVLNTSSAIVDAMIGHGIALDCYNLKLRENSIKELEFYNKKNALALSIVESIEDPIEKAKLFKELFTESDIEEVEEV
ncbi:MAG TPA: hypothetical protein VIN10_06865 [Bacteroidales bacterium]